MNPSSPSAWRSIARNKSLCYEVAAWLTSVCDDRVTGGIEDRSWPLALLIQHCFCCSKEQDHELGADCDAGFRASIFTTNTLQKRIHIVQRRRKKS